MDDSYVIGFKDVYPWVWSVMLGVAVTLAERRGAFLKVGTRKAKQFWAKNITALFVNVIVPAIVFGLTMTRLGPLYSKNMGFWQILGALYLAGVPLGTLHVWQAVAAKYGWMPESALMYYECKTIKLAPQANWIWATLAFG